MNTRLGLLAAAMLAGFLTLGSSPASAQTVQFFAVMAGGNETPAADPDGQGVASVMLGASGQICFSLLVRNIDNPTVAHIHEAAPGVAGPARIALTPVPVNGALGASAGCFTLTGATNLAILNRLRFTPATFYINVHNAAFPGGAIRGQLF